MMSVSNHARKPLQFQRIIVPLDESALAEQAVPIAARLARASGGSLHLLHVVHVSLDYVWQYGQDASRVSTNIIESSHTRAQAYLRRMSHREELHGLHVQTAVLRGDPVQGILDTSQADRADVIVMCSHGYSGIEHWLLGGVASKVVHQSSIPILLLHSNTNSSQAASRIDHDPVRVMVPLDGSSLAEAALEPAATLSGLLSPSGQQALHLAAVLPISKEEHQSLPERRMAIEQARLYLSILEQRLLQREQAGAKPIITTSVSIDPDIAHTIVRLAENSEGVEQASGPTRCDVIAVASRGRSASARWVIGSIAERVLTTTRLPVLLLHPQLQQSHLDEMNASFEHTAPSEAPTPHHAQPSID